MNFSEFNVCKLYRCQKVFCGIRVDGFDFLLIGPTLPASPSPEGVGFASGVLSERDGRL